MTQVKFISLSEIVSFDSGLINQLELIYDFLFKKYEIDSYKSITIIYIDLIEQATMGEIIKGQPYIRFHFILNSEDLKNIEKQRLILLQIIDGALHQLLSICDKLDARILDVIRDEIIKNAFEFRFVFKEREKGLIKVQLSVAPQRESFYYYADIIIANSNSINKLLFVGIPDFYFANSLFNKIVISNKFVSIFDKFKHSEFRVNNNTGTFEVINHSSYEAPPMYITQSINSTSEEKWNAAQNL